MRAGKIRDVGWLNKKSKKYPKARLLVVSLNPKVQGGGLCVDLGSPQNGCAHCLQLVTS